MADPQPSRLLALPLELRTNIYKELLCPDPDRVLTLYHDRKGRERSFNIDPTVLRVCKQLYHESVSLLYSGNVFEIHLVSPVTKHCRSDLDPDLLTEPQPLLRNDSVSYASDGLIYPHCLRKLRHINLSTVRDALWGVALGGEFWSHTGGLVMEILRELGEAPPTIPKAVLHLTFHPPQRWGGKRRGHTDEDRELVEMLALVREVGKARDVTTEGEAHLKKRQIVHTR